jgi:hypothetical protein
MRPSHCRHTNVLQKIKPRSSAPSIITTTGWCTGFTRVKALLVADRIEKLKLEVKKATVVGRGREASSFMTKYSCYDYI